MGDRVVVLTQRPGTIKSIYDIKFNVINRNPLNCRQTPEFSKYFDVLWKELGVDE